MMSTKTVSYRSLPPPSLPLHSSLAPSFHLPNSHQHLEVNARVLVILYQFGSPHLHKVQSQDYLVTLHLLLQPPDPLPLGIQKVLYVGLGYSSMVRKLA